MKWQSFAVASLFLSLLLPGAIPDKYSRIRAERQCFAANDSDSGTAEILITRSQNLSYVIAQSTALALRSEVFHHPDIVVLIPVNNGQVPAVGRG